MIFFEEKRFVRDLPVIPEPRLLQEVGVLDAARAKKTKFMTNFLIFPGSNLVIIADLN
ncbi:MAG: hypothetical protein F6K41_10795 [Symploca sp. SIO3E6]|nr:hypothetical protein [Caldora sp. SIO3E6]